MPGLKLGESKKLSLLTTYHAPLDSDSFVFFDALARRIHRDHGLADHILNAITDLNKRSPEISATQLISVEFPNLKIGQPNLKTLSQESLNIKISLYQHDEQGIQYNECPENNPHLIFKYVSSNNTYVPFVEIENIEKLRVQIDQERNKFKKGHNDILALFIVSATSSHSRLSI